MAYDVVTLVTAARGLTALRQVLAQLPSTFCAPIVCFAETTERTLDELRSVARLRIQWAEPGTPLAKGTVYLSRPNCGLVWRPDRTLSVTPISIDSTAQNPVDQFLASCAQAHGSHSACLILAGLHGDGVAGACALKASGATVLVLDRATAQYWGLAEPIVRAGAYDRVLSLAEAADALRACFTARDLLNCAEIQIQLGILLDTALALSGTRMGHITRPTCDARHLMLFVHRGLGTPFIERFDRIPVTSDTACGRAFLSRQRVVIDVMADSAYGPRDEVLHLGVRAIHATPIRPTARREVHGVLTTLFAQPHAVTPYEARDIDALAGEAGRLVAALN